MNTLRAVALMGLLLFSIPAHSQEPERGATENAVPEERRQTFSVTQEFLVESLASSVSHDVEQRLRAQQDHYWGIAAAVGTLLIGFFGFIGLGQLSGMRRQIREGLFAELQDAIIKNDDFRLSIERNVDGRLRTETKDQLTQLSEQVALLRLASLSERVSNQNGIDDYEKDALIEGVFVLKDNAAIVASSEFRGSLERILKSFYSADLDAELDRIHEQLGTGLLERDFRVALPLMLNYSERVLGGGVPSTQEKDRFLRYTTACKRKNRYEDALPYLFVATGLPKSVGLAIAGYKELLQDFLHLNDDEKRTCVRIMYNYAEAADPAATARQGRVREAFRTLLSEHGKDFSAWRAVSDDETTEF